LKNYSLTILEIIQETVDTKTFVFKNPIFNKIKYEAGQYLTLLLRINGRKYVRPYSFSSTPLVDSLLSITVKRVSNGIVSNYIHNSFKVGDVIEVMEPMGDFVLNKKESIYSIYFWGVGSGITPLFSLIKEVLNSRPNTVVHLVYGNKNKDSTIFKTQLKKLQEEHPLVFNMSIFYSQEDTFELNDTNHKGRITSTFVANLLSKNKNTKESLHYICGPFGLKELIKNKLQDLEVSMSSIFTEDFELTIDPKELSDVEDSKAIILLRGKLFEIFVPKGRSILDMALDLEIEIPYSCQTGNCNSCKAKLKEGRLKMVGLNKGRNDLGKDEFLLCCSYSLTKEICIEII
jgi:ring-1,2-phenylacetyl-CoA epoxidase subunit PaaE